MRAIIGAVLERQNDRSLATAAFFAAGMLFAFGNATVFLPAGDERPDLVAVGIACLIAGCGVLVAGSRFSIRAAGALMMLVFIVVVPSVLLAPDAIRSINTGLLFLPYLLYLVWFLPMWFARLLGYAWIALVDAFILARFGPSMLSVLVTLTVTGLVLGELIAHFKRRLERTSITDPLCGTWNAVGFRSLLDRAVAASLRGGRPLTMLYLDLDDFKRVNDRFGHSEGDRVLREFSQLMLENCRPQDVFARFGGDEFALLLIDADAALARSIAERLHREVDVVRWSYGIAEWVPGETPDAFISRADIEMLGAKRSRKGDAQEQGRSEHEPR